MFRGNKVRRVAEVTSFVADEDSSQFLLEDGIYFGANDQVSNDARILSARDITSTDTTKLTIYWAVDPLDSTASWQTRYGTVFQVVPDEMHTGQSSQASTIHLRRAYSNSTGYVYLSGNYPYNNNSNDSSWSIGFQLPTFSALSSGDVWNFIISVDIIAGTATATLNGSILPQTTDSLSTYSWADKNIPLSKNSQWSVGADIDNPNAPGAHATVTHGNFTFWNYRSDFDGNLKAFAVYPDLYLDLSDENNVDIFHNNVGNPSSLTSQTLTTPLVKLDVTGPDTFTQSGSVTLDIDEVPNEDDTIPASLTTITN